MKKNTLITILSIAVAVSLLLASYFYFSKLEVVVIQPETISDCASITGNFIRDACYMQIAAREKNESICYSIVSDNQKDLCFIELSKVKNDRNICELIIDRKYSKTKCYGEMNIILNE